ncbi:hypothetical protein ACQCX2_04930 [Propionibacteriaceae bacterium Y1700]|uniref:hypothetical protein n=1 Tax=Microlunatus sp. Y1700 TaxID=3418487 RepID=UPI003DA6D62D
MTPLNAAQAHFDGSVLTIGNAFLERCWRIDGAQLYVTAVTDLVHDHEWVAGETEISSLVRTASEAAGPSELRTERVRVDITGAEALQADLITPTDAGQVIRRFLVFDDFPAIGQQVLTTVGRSTTQVDDDHDSPTAATGTERDLGSSKINTDDVLDAWTIDPLHGRLHTTQFVDQTDHHHELLFEHEWSLHPSERRIETYGNLTHLEHRPSGCGLAMLKIAPGPEHRFVQAHPDLVLTGDQLIMHGHGGMPAGYRQWLVAYHGGTAQRTAAVQRLQLHLRTHVPGRDGLLVSNTWGDRSQDSRMNEKFLLAEVAAAQQLGVDVVQLDDGWQKGRTANAWNRPQDGAWGQYWQIDPRFWTPRPGALPHGLEPVIDAARAAGVGVGLWFSPDSSDELINWERDRDRLRELIDEHGISQSKLDGILLTSSLAEERLRELMAALLEHTDGTFTFDLDVTAQVRLGYWGAPHAGPIFVENRYTDFHNHWPHQTLRTLWKLAHHIHPVRLRMEFLNPYRNMVKYADDPLAPGNYPPASLFAMVMMASPLAWFELSESPPEFRQDLAELIMVWKEHRDAFQPHPILPIGEEPDGWSWSGFCSMPADGALYAVVYRPLGIDDSWTFTPPRAVRQVEWLHGSGAASVEDGSVRVRVDEPLGYGFLRLS